MSKGARRRRFLFGAALAVSTMIGAVANVAPAQPVAAAPVKASPRQRAPNIIVILADDLSWPDISAYGRSNVPTPNLDRLAKSGVAFTNGYVAASVCSVSRAGLLTGRAPAKMGFVYNINDNRADPSMGLPVDQATIGDRLKALGYHTAAIGKWHQGFDPKYYPTRRGFDEFWGFLAGETVYVDPKTPGIVTTPTKADHYPIDQRKPTGRIVTGPDATPVNDFSKYLTTDITDHAVDYIDHQTGQKNPFFLYLAYNAPHWPLQVPKTYYDRFAGIKDPVRRTYVAMISALDDNIGRVLDQLDKTGQRDNTMIVFLSDNGCPDQFGFCDCTHPLGAGKFSYIEGGTRVPFILSWPAALKPRAPVETPVSSLDILPTALEAAAPGKPLPKELDGRDLVATIEHEPREPRTLVWAQDPLFAVREGKWKLWVSEDRHETKLYDLDADPAESRDVAAENPKVTKRLVNGLTAWRRGLPPPRWPLTATKEVEICGRPTEKVS